MIGGWIISKRLGKGGNGEVFHAARDLQVGAIKLLGSNEQKRMDRFRDEVHAMEQCSDIPGVLPVLDSRLTPERGLGPWFVMGLAAPISEALGAQPSLRQVIEACAEFATTLSAMHARGFSHRDIKPDNLFRYNDGWAVGDFGLVSFEGKTAETAKGERVGPMFFMAPEMLNTAVEADGKCADVFSLAKTLWVLATGQRYPLPGHYDSTNDGVRIGTYIAEERTGPLDKLVANATTFAPERRPTMAEFAQELQAWLAPAPVQASALQLNIGRHAAELERRQLAAEAARLRATNSDMAGHAILTRIREALRPLAKDVSDSLKQAHFEPVNLALENRYWGFELGAGIPAENGRGGLLRLIVGLELVDDSTVKIASQIVLDRTSPSTFGVLLWDKTTTFLEGGSMETVRLQQLRDDVVKAMPEAVTLTLSLILDGAGRIIPSSPLAIGVQSSDGTPLQGADVVFIDPEGVYLRATSDVHGIAQTQPTHMGPAIAFVAHPAFHGECVMINKGLAEASLVSEPGVGSMIAPRGWTNIAGLAGQVEFISDAQKRLYLYGNNVSIDVGQTQPVLLTLGKLVKLRGTDGIEIACKVLAVSGSSFLVDVYSLPAAATPIV